MDEIKKQLAHLNSIFTILNEKRQPGHCVGIKDYLIEAYAATKDPELNKSEADFTILYHLKMLEAMEIVSYSNLREMADRMRNRELPFLLKQNLDMAKDSEELYDLISRDYLN